MLVVIGDLIDDIVVRPATAIRFGTDTVSHITYRRGGSAANVAAIAARLGAAVRFIGQVGDDGVGRRLVAELADEGVDVSHVRHAGRSGAIVVLVDAAGERTMLTDRRACLGLAAVDPAALDGVTTLHIPFYGVAAEPIASTVAQLAGAAHDRGARISVDLSSVALLDQLGRVAVEEWLARLEPHVIFANADEAPWLDLAGPSAVTVAKHGPDPAVVTAPGSPPVTVTAERVPVTTDTTGAGDAFAAGFLTAGTDPVEACRAGHRAAADHLRRLLADGRDDTGPPVC